ncbi:MAG: HXXEE domain-containing protein [Nibricoccus sp.]
MTTESIITLLSWAAPVCFGLHIIEELFWPGGFREWYHSYRPQVSGAPMSYYYKANVCYFAAVLTVPFSRHPAYGTLFVAGVLFYNLLFTHIRGALKTRSYSPGIVTGLLLYVPFFVASYGYLISKHAVSIPEALVCAVLSLGGEIYFALKKVTPKAGSVSTGSVSNQSPALEV